MEGSPEGQGDAPGFPGEPAPGPGLTSPACSSTGSDSQHQLCTAPRALPSAPLLIFVSRVESGLEQILVVPLSLVTIAAAAVYKY